MGVSTDAILFYGHVFNTEGCVPWETNDDDTEWEARYAERRGLRKPSESYPERWVKNRSEYNHEEQRIVALWTEYWAARRKLLEDCPCEIRTHCSSDYPMPYVAINSSLQCANRGFPVAADMEHEGSIDWDQQLEDFCDLMGIEPEGPPCWWLVSYWG